MSQRSPVVLITATTPWPLSARLAVRLIAHGCVVHALCAGEHVLTKVSGMGKVHRYSGPDSLRALERALAATSPSLIVPSDDRAVWQLHEIHELRPEWSELIQQSIGSSASFAVARSRFGLMDAARTLGIRVPATSMIRSQEDIRAWFHEHLGPAVVKLDGTWGGHGVQVVGSIGEASEAWRRFTSPQPPGTALKRWMIDRDPLAFWQLQCRQAPVASIQQFIVGRPANAMLAAWRGELLGLASVEVLSAQGPTGASTIVRLMRNDEITRTAELLVRHMGLSGFHGLDFILDETAGTPFLIELNPRCTQLGHLVLPDQGDLVGMVSAALGAPRATQHEPAIDRDVIAFFPQALAWNPDSPHMQRCHHDVPWSEPALVRELLLDPWPERKWLSRLYHRMRGRERNRLPTAANFRRLAAQCGWPSDNREEDFNRA